MGIELAILKMGSTYPELRSQMGDFEDWISSILDSSVKVAVIDYQKGEGLNESHHPEAVIITGSHSSVYDDNHWFGGAITDVRRMINRSVPLLGICFGHQLLSVCLGGKVIRNPFGGEIQASKLYLTPAGRESSLFRHFTDTFCAFESHHDVVVSLPEECSILAYNEKSSVQAFNLKNVYGVQFHPEFTGKVMSFYRQQHGMENGKEVNEENYIQCVQDQVIKNFISYIVRA